MVNPLLLLHMGHSGILLFNFFMRFPTKIPAVSLSMAVSLFIRLRV